MNSKQCQHGGPDLRWVNGTTGVCFDCEQQVQPPAPAPLPDGLVNLLAVCGRVLSSAHGDELHTAAIRIGVWLEGLADGERIGRRYPDLAPSWPREVVRIRAKLAEHYPGAEPGELPPPRLAGQPDGEPAAAGE